LSWIYQNESICPIQETFANQMKVYQQEIAASEARAMTTHALKTTHWIPQEQQKIYNANIASLMTDCTPYTFINISEGQEATDALAACDNNFIQSNGLVSNAIVNATYATYPSLQNSGCIVNFEFDTMADTQDCFEPLPFKQGQPASYVDSSNIAL
jgi:hypothetical protein